MTGSVEGLRVTARYGLIGGDLQLVDNPVISVMNGQIATVDQGGPSDIDLGNSLLVPGLINAHTHLSDAGFKEVGYGLGPWEAVMPPNGLRYQRLRAASRSQLVDAMSAASRYMLTRGTVAFGDYREGGLPGVQALQHAVADLPITAVIYGRHGGYPLPHTEDDWVRNAGLPAGYADELRDLVAACGGCAVPTANDTTDAGLLETSNVVRAAGGRLGVHALVDDRFREDSIARTGRGDLQRILDYLKPDHIVHMTAANPDELRLVAEADLPVVVCPRAQAVLGHGLPPVLEMLELGITVALGTDNAMLTSPNLLREMDFLSRGLRARSGNPAKPPALEVLRMATINAARALRLADRLGSLEEGKDATFISFSLTTDSLSGTEDPVASIVSRAEADDIWAVAIRGEFVAGRVLQRS